MSAPNPPSLKPPPPAEQLPEIRRPRTGRPAVGPINPLGLLKTHTTAPVSEQGEREAQIANITGNKIIGNYDVVENVDKNFIGFGSGTFIIPEDLGTTTALDKIFLNRFNYSNDKNVNMSLTKINEDTAKEYLFSIKLKDDEADKAFEKASYNFLKSVGDNNVRRYLFGITNENKIDFTKLYKFENKTKLPDALSLKYILFIGNDEIHKIKWDIGAPTDEEKMFPSFKYDTIILIPSSDTNFPTEGFTKINKIKEGILSKQALFCIYSIDFITFTAEMFDEVINNYYEMQGGGNKVVKKKCKNKLPKK